MRKMQFVHQTTSAASSQQVLLHPCGSVLKRWLGHWFFFTNKVIHPSQQSFLNHDPLKTRGSWMIEFFEDCIKDCPLVHKEDRKDSAFDAQYGGVQVLPIAIDVQFHVVIREAKHIAFLQSRHSVLLLSTTSHPPFRGNRPTAVVKAKVLSKVSSGCGYPCTPPSSLLNFHLPVSLVLQYRSRSPGRSSTTQAESILHHHSLLTHGAGVKDDLRYRLACWDVRCCSSPFPLTIQAIVHQAEALAKHGGHYGPLHLQLLRRT